jgi:hypothetical protein
LSNQRGPWPDTTRADRHRASGIGLPIIDGCLTTGPIMGIQASAPTGTLGDAAKDARVTAGPTPSIATLDRLPLDRNRQRARQPQVE